MSTVLEFINNSKLSILKGNEPGGQAPYGFSHFEETRIGNECALMQLVISRGIQSHAHDLYHF
jgi:hypothetical protein